MYIVEQGRWPLFHLYGETNVTGPDCKENSIKTLGTIKTSDAILLVSRGFARVSFFYQVPQLT